MAKPRIFISSTCFDLTDIRIELTTFLESYSFEVLNSQLQNFGVTPQKHSHTACLDQVENSDYLILIIGKRRGGTYIGSEKSITNEEYNHALKKGIPMIIFVDKRVDESIPLYKKNPSGDFSTVVDDKRIFHFIDFIRSASEDNWLHKYENIKDIKETLKAQFSYYLLLYSKSLSQKSNQEKKINSTKLTYTKFPSNLEKIKTKKIDQMEETGLRNGLKKLHKIMADILSSNGKNDNKTEKIKTLWLMGKYGDITYDDQTLSIDNALFKDYAWSVGRGKRVFKQMEPFGVLGKYFFDEEDGTTTVELTFKLSSEDVLISDALKTFVKDLIKHFGEDDAYELFLKADMRIYMS